MKTKTSLLALLLLAATPMFLSCGDHYDDGINWDGDNGGTLELVNGSNKDMILFLGQVPSQSDIIGGVRAGVTRKIDISKHVDDFNVGGYAVLRGISKEEYDKNVLDLSNSKVKIEFTGMVTYKAGTVYRYNIDLRYIGDNGFRVVNRGKIGMELRKDSPDGEKVAYLPAFQQNSMVYTQTTSSMTLFPVYVYFNKSTGEVTTLKSDDLFQSIQVAPRPLAPGSDDIQTYYLPNDATLTWQQIVGTLKQPCAYVTVVNNISNQSGYVTNAVSRRLTSQDGYDAIGSGENRVFEVKSSEEGAGVALTIVYYGGNIMVPVLKEGETDPPIIKNGYNYTVTVSYSPTSNSGSNPLANPANYKARIVEGEKRDISDQIESL